MINQVKVKEAFDATWERIKNYHLSCFKDSDKPLFLISDGYPGLWMEHVYDSVFLAKLDPQYVEYAKNAINLFIDKQLPSGMMPCYVLDGNKRKEGSLVSYSQIQECVSFFTLALEVYEMCKDQVFLETVYEAGKKRDAWFRKYRMTTGRGLIEMFVGFDTGHDNSGRLTGMAYPHLYSIDGVRQTAEVLPPDDGVTPILAVDMNCNFYANERALAKMARLLGKADEAEHWDTCADEIKRKIFEYFYNEEDAFFYDVDKNGNQRKYKSCTIFHLFLERVLDPQADKQLIDRIYHEHIKNPEEFWTPYPFPSMALNDPSTKQHSEFNNWGYFTEGLTILRCTRWMDAYGWGKDMDAIYEKWVEVWTNQFDQVKMAQEIDPITGVPTIAPRWYSSTMLSYIYGVQRLGLI